MAHPGPLKPCTLIGSDKGGVGKSLVAQIIVTAFDSAFEKSQQAKVTDERVSQRLKVIEVDNQRRLSTLLGDRVDLALDAAPRIEDQARDPGAGENFLNKVYDAWLSGPSLTDLGANVTTTLLDWAKHLEIADYAREDGIAFRLVTVLTPDDQALKSAFEALKRARSSLGADTELFMCFNDTVGRGGYEFFDNNDLLKQLRKLAEARGIHMMNLPYCQSQVMEYGRAYGFTIKEMLSATHEIAAKMVHDGKIDRIQSRVEVRKYVEWIEQVQSELMPLFERAHEQAAA